MVQLVIVAGGVLCSTIGARRQDGGQIVVRLPGTERHITNEEAWPSGSRTHADKKPLGLGLTMRGSVLEEERASIMGTPEEVATMAACMGALVEALAASPDDPHRGHPRLVRCYRRVCVTGHTLERVATRVPRQEGMP